MRHWLIIVLGVAACVHSNTVECEGRTCPSDTVCDTVHDQCVFPDQLTACDSKVDGDVCHAAGRDAICDRKVCVPGCGDHVQDMGEECDDGNFASHDGCSSACLSEFAGWKQWSPAWIGRNAQAVAYDVLHQQLVMVGGSTALDFLNDQWVRDVNRNWTQAATPMPGTQYGAMAYDPGRHRIVLFGGKNAANVLADTWEYDGSSWTKIPTAILGGRYGSSMVFDASRNKIVLFGGRTATVQYNETWEYDGATWTQVNTTGAPTPVRAWAAMAYDATRSRIVLFGGYLNGSLGDTWELVGNTWTQVAQVTKPVPRWGAAMAYLPSRGRVVLFGGVSNGVGADGDTWEYDGTWTAVTGPSTPNARMDATLTYDPDHAALVLVGGVNLEAERLDDVWEYSAAGTWVPQTPHFSPSLRVTPMVYDAAREQIVAFGGCTPGGFPLAETWTFGLLQGGQLTWTKMAPATAPSTLCGMAMAYDSTLQRVVLVGGRGEVVTAGNYSSPNPATWQWDGTTWTKTSEGAFPQVPSTPRFDATFADDAHDHTTLLFGGGSMYGSANDTASADSCWEHGASWKQCTSTGPQPQAGGAMAYDPIGERVVLFDRGGATWTYSNHAWTQLQLDRSPPVRVGARVVFDPSRGRVELFGGSSPNGFDFSDLWELGDTSWEPVRLLGAQPATRALPAFAPLPKLRALVMFGGNTFDDTWLLRYVSDTPDEVCADGQDNDGDRRIDLADPDCM